ncbi:MAG: hypothetical protein PSX36_09300 [bacterium]|nr:hypothetical protein [bacterium]
MKLGLRFFLSWIFSAIVMFTLFYVWHGLFLNDFKRIQFPLAWFVAFAALTYLIFGMFIYFLYESEIMKKIRNFFVRGVVCGAIAGFTLFMIATIVNISLTKHLSIQHLMIDCIWQISEQIIGGTVVVLFKIVIHEPQAEHA